MHWVTRITHPLWSLQECNSSLRNLASCDFFTQNVYLEFYNTIHNKIVFLSNMSVPLKTFLKYPGRPPIKSNGQNHAGMTGTNQMPHWVPACSAAAAAVPPRSRFSTWERKAMSCTATQGKLSLSHCSREGGEKEEGNEFHSSQTEMVLFVTLSFWEASEPGTQLTSCLSSLSQGEAFIYFTHFILFPKV